MRRRDHGRPIRAAMDAAGLNIPRLARATREVDPAHKGVSQALIGFLVTPDGTSARETCGSHSAELISTTLRRPLSDLFEPGVRTPEASTSTGEIEDVQHPDVGAADH